MNYGDQLECHFSKEIHQFGIPVLVWPQILRSRMGGQVDLVRIYRGELEVYEVKSQKIVRLLVNEELKQEYEMIHAGIDSAKVSLLSSIRKMAGVREDNVETGWQSFDL